MSEKLLSLVEKLRFLSTRLAMTKKEIYPTNQVSVDTINLVFTLMGSYDVDLGLTLEEFQALGQIVIRGLTRFNGFFPPELIRFFIRQPASRGVPLDQAIVYLKETFKTNGPAGTSWSFGKPDEKGEFIVRDLTRPIHYQIREVVTENRKNKNKAGDETPDFPQSFWNNIPKN